MFSKRHLHRLRSDVHGHRWFRQQRFELSSRWTSLADGTGFDGAIVCCHYSVDLVAPSKLQLIWLETRGASVLQVFVICRRVTLIAIAIFEKQRNDKTVYSSLSICNILFLLVAGGWSLGEGVAVGLSLMIIITVVILIVPCFDNDTFNTSRRQSRCPLLHLLLRLHHLSLRSALQWSIFYCGCGWHSRYIEKHGEICWQTHGWVTNACIVMITQQYTAPLIHSRIDRKQPLTHTIHHSHCVTHRYTFRWNAELMMELSGLPVSTPSRPASQTLTF